jgi:hypothetical protein
MAGNLSGQNDQKGMTCGAGDPFPVAGRRGEGQAAATDELIARAVAVIGRMPQR